MDFLPLATSFIPSLVNGLFGSVQNSTNMQYYQNAQREANEFARSERLAAQEYNSPVHQMELMAQAGMNPNLLSGSSFQPTQGVPNQSVSPPQPQNPWNLPTETLSQSDLNFTTANDVKSQQITRDSILEGLLKTQEATYNYIVSNTHVNEENIKSIKQSVDESAQRCKQILEEIKFLRSKHRLTSAQAKGQELQNNWIPRLNQANLNKITSDTRLNSDQMAFLRANIGHINEMARGLAFQNDLNQQNRWFLLQMPRQQWENGQQGLIKIKLENNRFRFDFGKYKHFYSVDKAFDYLNLGLDVVDKLYNVTPSHRMLTDFKGIIPFTSGQ